MTRERNWHWLKYATLTENLLSVGWERAPIAHLIPRGRPSLAHPNQRLPTGCPFFDDNGHAQPMPMGMGWAGLAHGHLPWATPLIHNYNCNCARWCLCANYYRFKVFHSPTLSPHDCPRFGIFKTWRHWWTLSESWGYHNNEYNLDHFKFKMDTNSCPIG